MREVFYTVKSKEIFVVPNFISEGYFCQEVIPRELRVEGPITMCRMSEPPISGSAPGSASYNAKVCPGRSAVAPFPCSFQRGVNTSIECGLNGSEKAQSLSPPP